MADLMQHVHALADEIGPRPATTDAEQQAAGYIDSVFRAHGLETEIQEFDAPSTYGWAFAIYHVLTIASAVVSGVWSLAVWPCFAISAITAFVLWSDLDTRGGLSSIMGKGPSQNVIARVEPNVRRGERVRRIVVVSHYDSARSSLAFSPSMVKAFPITFGLMKWLTLAVPIFILAMGLPFTARLEPWLWYATMAVSAYLLVPLFINVGREIAGQWVDGANDNASGVAAMLGVLASVSPSPEEVIMPTGQFDRVRHTAEEAEAAGVVPEGAVLKYSPAGSRAEQLPDDFEWAEPAREPARDQGVLDFETIEFAAIDEPKTSPTPSRPSSTREPAESERERVEGWNDDAGPDDEDAKWDAFARSAAAAEERPARESTKKRGLFSRLRKKDESEDVRGWLGVGDDFDARSAGAEIGSWDNFGEEEEDDDWGLKGGRAGEDVFGDPDFTKEVAARIRRMVTEGADRDLADKEVWFVATGAEESGTWGMRAFLAEYGDEIRDAFIINLDNVGTGSLYWVTAEGMARRYRSDRRLTSLAKRVSREQEILVKPTVYRGLSTDATPALARGYKAMSVMAFGAEGEIVGWHWPTDVAERVQPELIERAATLVTEMIREA